jgi:hypothetical protein
MAARRVVTGRVSFSARILWTLAFLTVLCISSASSRAQTTDLATAPIDFASRVVLQGQRAPWALPQNSQGPVPSGTMLEHLTLILKRSPQQQKVFEGFLQDLQDPTSRNYHRWLTPVQVGRRFGASQHDIDAISAWLRSQGLRVNSVSNSRMMIDFSGNASQVGPAFATEIRYYVVNGEQRMATADDPQIPAALAAVIQGVSGLYTVNDHPYHGAEAAHVPVQGAGSDLPALSICHNGSCSYYVTPEDFAVIYGFGLAPPSGLGQTIAIIGRARVYDPDLQNFESRTGYTFALPTVIVPPSGQDPGQPAGAGGTASGDQVEATLDVMRAASVAPGANVDLIISANNDAIGLNGIRVAAAYAVDTNPIPAQIMNISFGACEADRTLADVQFWDTLFSQAAGEGISVFVASGDAGAAGCDAYFQTPPQTQVESPNYICASSYSTCVGGTEFADTSNPSTYWSSTNSGNLGSALSYIPEGGWNEPLNSKGTTQAASSGGGYSSYIPTPSWQTGTGVPGTQGRYTPDIAFTSAGHDGYFGCLAASGGTHPGDCVVSNGEFYFEYFFGTSAAAPDMAGITALLNQQLQSPQGELNQRLYQLAANPANQVFHDVTVTTSGVSDCVVTTPSMCNNSTPSPTGLAGGLEGYLVTAGFDEVTGLGSIDVTNLLASWTAGSATTTTITSNGNPSPLGASVSFTATVTTAGANPPTGLVTFNDGATDIGFNYLSTLNGSQIAVFATSSLAVGSHSITALYHGDANNAASQSSVLTQTISSPTFTWAANGSTTGTVFSGQSATYNFTATPTGTGTFPATVTFSCSGLPDTTVSCSFYPTQINALSGSTPVQVTITTTGPNSSAANKLRRMANRRSPWFPLTLPLAGIVMAGFAGRRISKYSAIVGLCVSLALLGLLVACGGGGSSPPPIGVTVGQGTRSSVFPNDKADNWPAQTAQFTATVANSTQGVIWTASSGTITANTSNPLTATYTAPTVASGLPTSVTITATSQADSTKFGSATETLTPATIPGTYSNIMVTATESTTVNPVPVMLTVK